MGDPAPRQEPADLRELVDDGLVGVTLLAVLLQDAGAAEEWQILAERAVFQHVVGDDLAQHPQLAVEFELVHPVAGRAMDEAGALLVGDEGRGPEIARRVPFALGPLRAGQRMHQPHRGQLHRRHVAHPLPLAVAQPRAREGVGGQLVGQNVALARFRPAFLGRLQNLVEAVVDPGPVGDASVRRNRPGRRRPDHDIGALEGHARRLLGLGDGFALVVGELLVRHLRAAQVERRDPELHPDGEAVLVVILDLRVGERRLLDGRPHHRLRALVERAVHQEFLEFLRDHPLGVVIHGQVGPVPGARHPEPLELSPLHVDPLGGEIPAFAAELHHVDTVLVLPLGAVALLDLPLDRQAVAVPAGNVARIVPHHLVRAHHDVLDGLVQRMPDMEVAVGIGRPVMEREGRPVAGALAQPVVDADPLPPREPVGLPLRQARAHREVGRGQVQRVLVIAGRVGRVGAHGRKSRHRRV